MSTPFSMAMPDLGVDAALPEQSMRSPMVVFNAVLFPIVIMLMFVS